MVKFPTNYIKMKMVNQKQLSGKITKIIIMATILVLTTTACQTQKGKNEKKWNPTFSILRTIITGTK